MMKKSKILPVLVFVILFSAIFASCGKGKGDSIARKWKYRETIDKDGKMEADPSGVFPNPTFESDGSRATLTLYIVTGVSTYDSYPYSGTVKKRDDGTYEFLVDNAKNPFTVEIEGDILTVIISKNLRYIFEAE